MAFDAAEDAQALRTAMKGFGTDDNALISIIASKSNAQLQEIRAAYQSEFGKDLIPDIQSECSGLFEDVLVGLLLTPAEFDASTCNKAIKGAGTDEDILVETLAHRTDKEMEALQEAYQQKYNTSLTSDVEGDAGGHAKLVLLGLINKNSAAIRLDPDYLREVCTTLYNAGEGKIGTDEAVFIDTLTNLDSVYLRALNVTYARMYGDSLVSAASQEMSGTLVEAIKALLAPQYEYYADILFKCLDGAGTDEARMNRIICSRREQLPWINEVFIHKYGMSLHHRVCTEVGGDAGKVISAITKNV